ncbi:MAG: HAD-IIIA family hydrolase [Gemmatimonadales bacterium]
MASNPIFGRYKLFIFDADDTLRRTIAPGKPCPHRPGEWVLMPGVRDLLTQVPWGSAGSPLFGIASNQDQVGYGRLTITTARNLLRDLAHAAADCQPPDPALQLCPHRLEQECECRKPQPGMLLTIMGYYGVGPDDTLFVGNHEVDREAAARARTSFNWSSSFFPQPAYR